MKKNTAILFQNAIGVTHENGSEFFTSFLQRDKAFDLLNTLWHKAQGEKSLGIDLQQMKEEKIKHKQAPRNNPEGSKGSLKDLPSPREDDSTTEVISPRSEPDEQKPAAKLSLMGSELPEDLPFVGMKEEISTSPPSQIIKPSSDHQLDLAVLRNVKKKEKIRKTDGAIPARIQEEMNQERAMRESIQAQSQGESTENDPSGEQSGSEDVFKDIIFPKIGNCPDHCDVDSEPCIDQLFANVSIKEFYAKVLYSPQFWEHVFVVTDSEDITIPTFGNPANSDTYLERLCRFVAPIKGAPVGPKQTRVEQTHRVSFPDEE